MKKMKNRSFTAMVMMTVLLAAIMLAPPSAISANITVTACTDSGAGSLRDAITSASAGDTINFGLDCTGAGAVTLTSTLSIGKNLTIDGTGHNITVSGNSTVRVFDITAGNTVILTKLNIINGNVLGSGAGINNAGTLTVSNSTFSGNSATSSMMAPVVFGNGGSINNTGILTVNNSTFSGNSASSGACGGIYNAGTSTVNNSTFSTNSSGSSGSAIYNYSGSTLTVNNSTVSNHSTASIYNDDGSTMEVNNSTFLNNVVSSGDGGAINNRSTLTVNNSTFSGNQGYGGAIYNSGGGTPSAPLTVNNSTFSGNTGNSGSRGGITNNTGSLTLKNSILANNTGGDCRSAPAPTVGSSNNLIKSTGTSACGLTDGANGNIIGTSYDPLLGTLASNGGLTQTMALGTGSPAIDAGSACTTNDQRGGARVGTCDIGAYEFGAVPPPVEPNNLTATTASQTQINLSWTDNSSNEIGFKIFRDGNPTPIITTATDATSYNDTGLTCNTAYTYTVKATNAGGDSAATSAATATTSACVVPITASVTLDSLGSITGSTVLATATATGAGIGERGFYWWIPPSTETHFGGSESGLLPEGNYGAGNFSLTLTGLKPGNKYHVKAYVKVGGQIITSDEQLFTTATTGATGKTAPTVLTDTVNYTVSGSSITVSGEITDIGSSAVNVYGFVYAPHTAPFTGDDMLKTGDRAYAMWDKTPLYQGMKFTGTVKNIPPGKWYLRTYAHNVNPDSDAAQTASLGYGEEISFTIACTPETCIPGDVNGDGKVSLDDAMLVLRILAGIPVGNVNLNADVNGDGKIGLEELGYILQKVAELRSSAA